MMFETFNVPVLYITVDAVLALYASGRTTGVVLDLGEHRCRAVPVFHGAIVPHAINEVHTGGRELTAYMHQMLEENPTTREHLLRASAEEAAGRPGTYETYSTEEKRLRRRNAGLHVARGIKEALR